jgi:hypothetical protein
LLSHCGQSNGLQSITGQRPDSTSPVHYQSGAMGIIM